MSGNMKRKSKILKDQIYENILNQASMGMRSLMEITGRMISSRKREHMI